MSQPPKPPVMWSTVITRWGVLALLAVALVIALRPTVAVWMAGAKKHSTSGDPADIRLVGVAPDGDDILLDPRGHTIPGVKLDWPGERTLSWSPQQLQRDFLFELGPGTEAFEFLPEDVGVMKISGNRGWVNSSSITLGRERVTTPEGRRRILVRLTLNENYWGRVAFFGSGQRLVEEVDFDLHFFARSRGTARMNFDGPFLAGQTNSPREAAGALVTVLTNIPYLPRDSTAFRAWRATTGPWGSQVFVYDTDGKRQVPETRSSTGGPFGWTNEFVVTGVPLARVAAITVGEEPRVKTFHNVLVKYPERSPSTHSPLLDRLAVALGQTNQPMSAVEHYSPRTSLEAMTILELLPGSRTAMSSLTYGGSTTNFSELTPAQRGKLRKLANFWAEQTDPYSRQLGLRTGLRGGWPEFTTLALARLTGGPPQERLETAASLAAHPNGLGQEHLPGMAALARTNSSPGIAPNLAIVILRIGGPAATNALLELARAEDPLIWWSALARLGSKTFEPVDALTEEMQQRLWMVKGLTNSGFSRAVVVAARTRLAGLLTHETRTLSYTVFEDVLRAITRQLDRPAAMEAIITYLRSGTPADWQRNAPAEIVRQINDWYGKDFGGLGDGKKAGRGYPAYNAWPGIVEDVLEFYDKLKREERR